MAQDYGSPQANALLGGVSAGAPASSPTTKTSTVDYGSAAANALLGGMSSTPSPSVTSPQTINLDTGSTPKPVDTSTFFSKTKDMLGSKLKDFWNNFTTTPVPAYGQPSSALSWQKNTPALQATTLPGAKLNPDNTIKVGTDVKLPFVDKGFTIPNNDILGGTAKQMIELPEKASRSLTELVGLSKQNSETRKSYYTVPSYAETAGKTTGELIDQGIPPAAAVILGSASSAGEFAQDALMYEGLLTSGARKATGEVAGAITNDELRTAHEFLGNPKTMAEAKANYLKIQKEFHPDITGGDDTISKQANNAFNILKKEGIPTGKAAGVVSKTPKPKDIPPKLLEETNQHIAEHGPDLTHQALVETGATPEQAQHIIDTANAQKIAEARANPAEVIKQEVAKVVPAVEIPKENVVYHGTKAPITSLKEADVLTYGKANSLYGQGLYLTDNPKVAEGYSVTKGSGETGKVLSGTIKSDVNLLNLDEKLPKNITNAMEKVINEGNDGAHISFKGKNGQLAMKEFMNNLHGLPTSEASDIVDSLHYNLEQLGYDGFKHTGGQITGGVPSNVSILWDGGKRSITDKIEVKTPKPETSTKELLGKEPTYKVKPAEKTIVKKIVKAPTNQIKEEISKLYDNVLEMYKKEMPHISDSIHEKNVEHLLKLISSNNVKALSNFLSKDNPTSQKIFAELTGKIWGKGLNQTIIKDYKGNYMQDILERNKPAPEVKVPEHFPGESIGIKITGEEYRGSRDGLPISIPLEVTIDGDIKYKGKTVANIETLDMDNLNDALDDEGVSFIYKDKANDELEYSADKEQEIIEDAFKQIIKERDDASLAQYERVFGKDNLQVGDTIGIDSQDLKATGPAFRMVDKNNTQAGFINPGAMGEAAAAPVKAFLKEDVLPKGGAALEGLKNTMEGFVHAVAPTVGVKPTDLDQIMKMKGAQDKQEYIFAKTNEIIKKGFNKMTREENIAFIDRMKTGAPQPTEALQAIADGLREIDTRMWNEAKQFKPSLSWKENHFRVMWKVVPGKPEALGFKGAFKRPLQGTKGFTKQSTLEDMSEGLAKGGVPISYNPIELFQYAYSDMQKFITAQKMIAELKEQGQMQFYKTGKFPNDGYIRLDDNVARVYMPVETANGGTVIAPTGEWYIEPNVGRILNNYLSKDHIRASDFGRGLLAIKNVYTSIELAASPFHAVFESLEAMGSQVGLGIQKIAGGNIKGGLKDIGTAPISPYSTAKLGADSIKFMTMRGPEGDAFREKFMKQYPDAGQLLDDLFTGGGRMKMDDAYRISTAKVFAENLKTGNYIGAGLRALPSLSQKLMEPLFDTYIPRLKIGTFLKEYSNDLVENSKALAEGTVTRETLARDRWNFVEDRFGEMNFDNLFWNKTFKTAMQISFRSVTWKMGNLRGTGGAIWGQGKEFYDAARAGRAPRLNPKMAWLLGMSVITAVIGYTLQKAMTGKTPQNIKDFIYPQIDDKGNRVSTPTYWKDNFHLAHDPVGYVSSSTTGLVSKILDVWQNQDFYGVEIHNDNDPFFKRAEDNMLHILPTPFAVSSTISLNKSGASPSKQTMGFFGFTKAPGYINQTEIETKIFADFQKRLGAGVLSQEDADVKNQKSAIIKAYQNGDSDKANTLLKAAVDAGIIKDVNAFVKKADYPGDVRAFKALPSNDQRSLLKNMSAEEINKYAWFVNSDVKETFGDISDKTNDFVNKVSKGELVEPIYSKGSIVQ